MKPALTIDVRRRLSAWRNPSPITLKARMMTGIAKARKSVIQKLISVLRQMLL
jgi:hypothetical protein